MVLVWWCGGVGVVVWWWRCGGRNVVVWWCFVDGRGLVVSVIVVYGGVWCLWW